MVREDHGACVGGDPGFCSTPRPGAVSRGHRCHVLDCPPDAGAKDWCDIHTGEVRRYACRRMEAKSQGTCERETAIVNELDLLDGLAQAERVRRGDVKPIELLDR